MFCTKCGAQMPDGASFCTSCGSPLNSTQPVQQPAGQYQQPVQQYQQPVYQQPVQTQQPVYQQPAQPVYGQQPAWQATPVTQGKERTVADKVIMIILMLTSLGGALIPLLDWVKVPLADWLTTFLETTTYSGGKNVFGIVAFLDQMLDALSYTLMSGGYSASEVEVIGILVIFMRFLAIMMVISMALTLVMIILGLCFRYKPSCIFSMISCIVMFISSICFLILIAILTSTSDVATVTAAPVLAVAVSLVNLILTIVAMVITTKARNKKAAARR